MYNFSHDFYLLARLRSRLIHWRLRPCLFFHVAPAPVFFLAAPALAPMSQKHPAPQPWK